MEDWQNILMIKRISLEQNLKSYEHFETKIQEDLKLMPIKEYKLPPKRVLVFLKDDPNNKFENYFERIEESQIQEISFRSYDKQESINEAIENFAGDVFVLSNTEKYPLSEPIFQILKEKIKQKYLHENYHPNDGLIH